MSNRVEFSPGVFVKTNLPIEEATKMVQNIQVHHLKNKKLSQSNLGETIILFFELDENGFSIWRGPLFSLDLENELLENEIIKKFD